MKLHLLCVLVALAPFALPACGGGDTPCSPPGFTMCEGNTLQTCVGDPGASEGVLEGEDCTEDGRVCRESIGNAVCTMAAVDTGCFARDALACSEADEVVRCVWVSEEPHPNFSGDIGVWRVQTDCAEGGQVCDSSGSTPVCADAQ
jgi:hypothetical protein